MMKLGLILSVLFLVSCAHHKHHNVQVDENWGNLERVTNVHEHVYTAGQPDEAAITAFKENGGAVVVNLREESEAGFSKDEKKWVETKGMTYYHIPINGKDMKASQFDAVEKVLTDHRKQKVLVHCSSSNRAGAWFAYHVSRKHKDKPEKAMKMGEAMGMTKSGLKTQMENMISE
ncbi:MAG: sulfur transferase domain-containing protein [Bdellovibrionota bacterium]|nr:sulfur transferase domain-containing protein [Bdellovibrionota bacterium]